MSEIERQYNWCLDFVKGIACVFVVFMHCEFPGIMGTIVQAVSRFCVPLFFMVSGYFCYLVSSDSSENHAKMLRKIKHVAKITLYACIAYVVFDVVQYYVFLRPVFDLNFKKIFYWVALNKPSIVAGQYWFLFALLYDYLLFGFVLKFHLVKKAYAFAAAMILTYILLAQGLHTIGIHIQNCIYRNFLIEGFAFFMLGNWIHANQLKLKFANGGLLIALVISTLLCLVERFLLGRDFGVNIATFPQVFVLFLYAVNNPTRHKGFVQVVGQRYSMFVYIIHPMVWHTFEYVYTRLDLQTTRLALYLMPVVVLLVTLLISHIIYYAKNSSYISLHR